MRLTQLTSKYRFAFLFFAIKKTKLFMDKVGILLFCRTLLLGLRLVCKPLDIRVERVSITKILSAWVTYGCTPFSAASNYTWADILGACTSTGYASSKETNCSSTHSNVGISPHQRLGNKGGRLNLQTWPLNCNHSKWFHLFLEDIIQ